MHHVEPKVSLHVRASIASNEEDRDTQELDEMQIVVDLLPTLMIEIKTVFLFGGGEGGSSGGSREWSISRYIYVMTHPFSKGLCNLWQQEKLNPRTKSFVATTAVAITW
jgi:hypothetical protein